MGKLDAMKGKGFAAKVPARKISVGDVDLPGLDTGIPAQMKDIPVEDIEYNEANAIYRELDTDTESIEMLAEDIARNGLLHNLVVCPAEDKPGKYVLLSGERRLRALRLCRQQKRTAPEGMHPTWKMVPCRVMENLNEVQKVVFLDAANLQVRGGLGNEVATRKATARFVENLKKPPFNMTEKQAGEWFDRYTAVNKRTRDRNLAIERHLAPELQGYLDEGKISKVDAINLLRLTETEQQRAAEKLVQIEAMEEQRTAAAVRKGFVRGLVEAVAEDTEEQRMKGIEAAYATAEAALKNAVTRPPRAETNKGRDGSYIEKDLPKVRKKLQAILKTEGIDKKLAAYSNEERAALVKTLEELAATVSELKQKIADI